MRLFRRNKIEEKLEYPWYKYYKKEERNIKVSNKSIYEYFETCAFFHKYETAINYFNTKITYEELIEEINIISSSLINLGIKENDCISICMPNTPEAVIAFYAVNKIGAISCMIHPLSSEEEIKHTIKETNSKILISVNFNYNKINNIIKSTKLDKVVLTSPKISMPDVLKLAYYLKKEIKENYPEDDNKYISWKTFKEIGLNNKKDITIHRKKEDTAIYLHSGGTTGKPKTIVITNENINTVLEQIKIVFPELGLNDKFLSILPMFHCFGLVVCILGPLVLGSTAILVPQFNASRFDKLIKKYKPNLIIGVPTLFEALVNNPYMRNVDMSYVKYIVSGGDSLSKEKNEKINVFLKEHNCNRTLIQGYGMTETTGGAVIGGRGSNKLGSVGIPLPGNKVKIIDPITKEEKSPNEIGEIYITGPIVMKEYLNNKKETEEAVIIIDNERWVHTGDLAYMDEDGVIFYVQRLKRMLIVSGYNVYPSHLEEVIQKHPKVKQVGVIGIPHPYKVQVPKAYIVLKDNKDNNHNTIKEIEEYCKKELSYYMIPKKFVFRESLPTTMIGKIDYKKLEKENEK